ncbi:hypothetical protein [Rhodococcus sp. IEGM 1379]|uniref:phage terminase large subunit family protein n=1 Tax=Rhodococcus sp. IEGM 1379 TaxID=3047086 RepID=UPI0024B784A5|nr:hypothetical protein [Rhodococcus sp. IEGM 1379]MDI9915502.1 hypothetical protein [Rhodococcus sp. IEGM 1379]
MELAEVLRSVPRGLLATSAGRRLITKDDPMLFAVIYLLDHLKFEDEQPSLSEFHVALAEYGKSWTAESAGKDCFIAPRSAGKTTWLFLILTLWAAAHGHLKFIAAFSDSAAQATQHLQTFKHELDSNELLRKDYPELCKPMMGNNVKRHIAQSNEQIQQANGFAFVAKGIDAKSLGMKIGNRRPDLILLDDIEPPEANYSASEAVKRLGTILNSVFPLSIKARIAIVGTTTMSNSIIDQLRKVGEARFAWQLSADRRMQTKPGTERADNTYYVNLDKGILSEFSDEDAASGDRRDVEGMSAVGELQSSINSISVEGRPESADSLNEAYSESIHRSVEVKFDPIDREIESVSNSVKIGKQGESDLSLTVQQQSGSESEQKSDVKSSSENIATSTRLSCVSNFDNSKSPASRYAKELEKLIGKSQPALQEFDQQHVVEPSDFYESLDQALRWVIDEQINVHYFPAIMVDSAGTERSLWPEFWSLDYLNGIRHTRNFYMNYLNKPTSLDAAYWSESDIPVAQLDSYRYTMISVDPAVKTKASNDYTGIVVISFGENGKCYVRHAEQLRIVSTDLKQKVTDLIEKFDARLVYCEVNQGGDLWRSVFDGIPAKFKSVHQTEKKELRAARALDYYKKNLVFHTKNFADLEEQMFAFPKVPHDDILDALSSGVHYFLGNSRKSTARKRSYL